MKETRIAIDIDDVLGSQNEAMLRFANERYGHNHTIDDYTVEGPYWGYWRNIWGVCEEEGRRRIQEYHELGGLDTHEPIPQAVEAVTELDQRYGLVIVTARERAFEKPTREWLGKHFPVTFSSVHFLGETNGQKETKAEVCKRLGADYLIDDYPEHCRLAVEDGVQPLLFGSYGWNKYITDLPSEVIRVRNWAEVLEYFSDKA